MCMILKTWFGKDLGDGVMLGSTLGISITTLKMILFFLFYWITNDKNTFWNTGYPIQSFFTYFVYDCVILLAFIIIFIGGKKVKIRGANKPSPRV